MSSDEGSSRVVTCRVHPPSWMRRCTRSKEYQIGVTSPRSVVGGRYESGFKASRALLIGPGLVADRFPSPFATCSLVCPNPVTDPRAPALRAAAAAPKTERRPTESGEFVFRINPLLAGRIGMHCREPFWIRDV